MRGAQLSEPLGTKAGPQGCWGGERPPALRLVWTRTQEGWAAPAALSRPPPATPTLSFQPSTPGTCGQAADHVVRQVTARVDLAVAACGCLTQVPVASGPAACENRLHLPSPHRLGPSGGCDEQWVVGICIHKSVTSLRQKGENCS